MGFPTGIGVCNSFIVVEQTGTGQVEAKSTGTKIGTVRQVGLKVTQVEAYQIVLFNTDDAKVFTQNGASYSVIDESKVILITEPPL